MKKNRLFFIFATLFVAMAVMFSCQKDDISVNSENGLMLKAAYTENACETECIDLDNPEYWEMEDQKTVQWGGRYGNDNTKIVDLIVYNTETDFVIKFKSTHSPQNLYIDGELILEYNGAVDTWVTHSYTLDDEWEACDLIEHEVIISGQGPEAIFEVEYNLIGICEDCETALTGETECGEWTIEGVVYNRKVTYTFSTEFAGSFKLQGGLTNFTGEEYIAQATVGTVDTWIPGGSSNRILRVQGDLDDCGEVVLTVYWYSSNADEYITGDWSVELDGVKILIIDKLMCDYDGEGYPPPVE
jgi:hypothetical protein